MKQIQPLAGMRVLPNGSITFYYGSYCLYHLEDSRNLIWQLNTKSLLNSMLQIISPETITREVVRCFFPKRSPGLSVQLSEQSKKLFMVLMIQ